MVSALWIAGTCAILAVALLVAGYVTVEAQEDTRHSTFPPNAHKVLVWDAGQFDVTCADSQRESRTATFTHLREPLNNEYFVIDLNDTETTHVGFIRVGSGGSSSPQFHLFGTEINSTAWVSYGVAYNTHPICTGGEEIFDFSITGTCDGSSISVSTSDPKIVMTQTTSTDPGRQYHAWCGYIPDDLDRLNNKIF